MADTRWIEQRLQKAAESSLTRDTEVFPGVGGSFEEGRDRRFSFSSNDYLDFTSLNRETESASRDARQPKRKAISGVCSSRLISGTQASHIELEKRLATFLNQESSLVFGSGYLANLGLAGALIRREDLVFSDRLVHASLIDSIQLSRARSLRFKHNDSQHLESLLKEASATRSSGQRFVIVTESVFSMDGDLAPLRELLNLAARYNAELVVDEAHAFGVFGPNGSGRLRELQDLDCLLAVTGSMSKSFAAYGGLLASKKLVRSICVQHSRSFIYNTALPPLIAEECIQSIDRMEKSPELGSELLRRSKVFRDRLENLGFSTCGSESQIVPVLVGSAGEALRLAAKLREEGIFCHAIRSPTVPVGTERLRFSVTLAHSDETLDWVAETLLRHFRCPDG